MKRVEDVAKILIALCKKSKKGIKINAEKLREISERTSLRDAFLEELEDYITNNSSFVPVNLIREEGYFYIFKEKELEGIMGDCEDVG